MKPNQWLESSKRFYRRLLRLYPQSHRIVYETEMFNVFTDQCREAYQNKGWRGIAFLWPRILADTFVAAIREHMTDPRAKLGLLDAAPDEPLPWKGVLLVLIPGLIFFVSQVVQVTTDKDWYFLVFYRAGYFLILPVLLAWLLTRRFPVWGLIPLGLLYAVLESYSPAYLIDKIPLLRYLLTLIPPDTQLDPVYLILVLVCVILIGGLIWYGTRHWQISRAAWIWLGVYGLLVILRVTGEIYRGQSWYQYLSPAETNGYMFQTALWNLYDTLPFLLLVFIGMFFARKYGGLTFLLLLGYVLPTILFGRYDPWQEATPFYLVSISVLVYRLVVAVIAPIWLVRAASVPRRQRAAVIPVAMGIACHITLNLIAAFAWSGRYGYTIDPLDLAWGIWGQIIIAAGLGLAVALYLPTAQPTSMEVQPSTLSLAEE
jgi:hypothetical protein